jgi:Domain of unknown function (DUF4134)
MKKNNQPGAFAKSVKKAAGKARFTLITLAATVAAAPALAQNGSLSGGLNEIKTNATTISTTGQQICYALAVIIGIVGAVRILSKQSGDRENLHKEIAGWFGATLFFAAAGVMIRALMA